MRRTELLQEIRKMRFEEILATWTERKITQATAAIMLGVSDRTFRRYIARYEEEGLAGLIDLRLNQPSHRKASDRETAELAELYRTRHHGWNVSHFHAWYRRQGGGRSYTWVKNALQAKSLVRKGTKKGVHRLCRERSAFPGMMLLQDGSSHEWVPGKKWDLIVTMDDATNKHYSMFFVDEEGTQSSFRGVADVIYSKGLFCSLYTDRASHYWHTPEAGGKVDKKNLTQFGRAMHQLGIEMIPSYSPEARGRIERVFLTHQDRLVKELAYFGIIDMEPANDYIQSRYLPEFNALFTETPREEGTAFVPLVTGPIADILCEQYDRVVGRDNCVSFENMTLQIPPDKYRCNYVKTNVRVHRYADGTLAIFHGPRKLANYSQNGKLLGVKQNHAA